MLIGDFLRTKDVPQHLRNRFANALRREEGINTVEEFVEHMTRRRVHGHGAFCSFSRPADAPVRYLSRFPNLSIKTVNAVWPHLRPLVEKTAQQSAPDKITIAPFAVLLYRALEKAIARLEQYRAKTDDLRTILNLIEHRKEERAP
jgi:hypothetical protein